MQRFLIAPLMIVFGACAAPQAEVATTDGSTQVRVAGSVGETVRSLATHAAVSGWEILEANVELGVVEVVANQWTDGGLFFRDRWSFYAPPGGLKIWNYRESSRMLGAAAFWSRIYADPTPNERSEQQQALDAILQRLGTGELASL